MSKRIPKAFYKRPDVVQIAQELLGKYLVTNFEGKKTVGKIVETEAYRAPEDKASHAYNNRKTPRTKPFFAAGGIAYVYICYGVHHLFNVITGEKDVPHAILIRGIEPVEGIETMLERRKMTKLTPRITAGPGSLSVAFGLTKKDTFTKLFQPDSLVWLEDRNELILPENIVAGPRVGMSAKTTQEWQFTPWRFSIRGNKYVSPPKNVG